MPILTIPCDDATLKEAVSNIQINDPWSPQPNDYGTIICRLYNKDRSPCGIRIRWKAGIQLPYYIVPNKHGQLKLFIPITDEKTKVALRELNSVYERGFEKHQLRLFKGKGYDKTKLLLPFRENHIIFNEKTGENRTLEPHISVKIPLLKNNDNNPKLKHERSLLLDKQIVDYLDFITPGTNKQKLTLFDIKITYDSCKVTSSYFIGDASVVKARMETGSAVDEFAFTDEEDESNARIDDVVGDANGDLKNDLFMEEDFDKNQHKDQHNDQLKGKKRKGEDVEMSVPKKMKNSQKASNFDDIIEEMNF